MQHFHPAACRAMERIAAADPSEKGFLEFLREDRGDGLQLAQKRPVVKDCSWPGRAIGTRHATACCATHC